MWLQSSAHIATDLLEWLNISQIEPTPTPAKELASGSQLSECHKIWDRTRLLAIWSAQYFWKNCWHKVTFPLHSSLVASTSKCGPSVEIKRCPFCFSVTGFFMVLSVVRYQGGLYTKSTINKRVKEKCCHMVILSPARIDSTNLFIVSPYVTHCFCLLHNETGNVASQEDFICKF